jgi:hypothetical protein
VLGKLSMASKVRGFGDIEPIDAGSLRAGDRFLAYVELMHWPFVAGIGDRMTAHARYMLRIEDAKGTVIWRKARSTPSIPRPCRPTSSSSRAW